MIYSKEFEKMTELKKTLIKALIKSGKSRKLALRIQIK